MTAMKTCNGDIGAGSRWAQLVPQNSNVCNVEQVLSIISVIQVECGTTSTLKFPRKQCYIQLVMASVN